MSEEHQQRPQAPPSASETTSIALPPSHTGPLETQLSEQDNAAIKALPGRSALLIAHAGPNQGSRFLVDQDQTTVGRHPEADIFLDDVTVSRRHVRIHRTDTGFEVEDLGSLNGTYVNQDRVDRHTLSAGDEVQVGKFRLTFYSGTS